MDDFLAESKGVEASAVTSGERREGRKVVGGCWERGTGLRREGEGVGGVIARRKETGGVLGMVDLDTS